MVAPFPSLSVGEPLSYQALSVFPLFMACDATVEYWLSSNAIADQSVTVEEITESGAVPDLRVENRSDTRVTPHYLTSVVSR